MNEVVFKTLKEKDFIVKNFLFKVALELKLSLQDMVLLIYFMNQETPMLDIPHIKASVYLSEEEIMESFAKLTNIGLISLNITKKSDGTREEVISLDNIIRYITTDITKKHKADAKENLFSIFENEFGRPLSTMEFEIINEWLDSGFSKEIIIEALKESVYNGYHSLKSISSKLQYYKEKGINSKSDVANNLKKETVNDETTELFDYNWLEDE